jgi:putative nucleotidyltransferase with HDIG domain
MKIFRSKKNQSTAEGIIELAQSIDRYEGYVLNHATEMARISQQLAQRLGVSGADLNAIKLAALLHDSGQMQGKMQFIQNPQLFDFRQRVELWRHPLISEQFVAQKGLPRAVQLLVRWHHEWWNGNGYPDRLAGEAIPLGARIIRLLDSYSALRSARPYRAAYSEEDTINIITEQAGLEFDPLIVREFLAMLGYLVTAEVAMAENNAERSLDTTIMAQVSAISDLTTSEAFDLDGQDGQSDQPLSPLSPIINRDHQAQTPTLNFNEDLTADLTTGLESAPAPPPVAATTPVSDALSLPFKPYTAADAPTVDFETDSLPNYSDLVAESMATPTATFEESSALLDSDLLANYTNSLPETPIFPTVNTPPSGALDTIGAEEIAAAAISESSATLAPPRETGQTTPLNQAYNPLAFANANLPVVPTVAPPDETQAFPATTAPPTPAVAKVGTLPLTSPEDLLANRSQRHNLNETTENQHAVSDENHDHHAPNNDRRSASDE